MSLIIGTGSNIGDKATNLEKAKKKLMESFFLIAESRIYTSAAVDYVNQPDFFKSSFGIQNSQTPRKQNNGKAFCH